MKQRRTKEQKLKASNRKITATAPLDLSDMVQVPLVENTRVPILQDVPLIKRDLRKTLVISLVLATILLGIYLYLR